MPGGLTERFELCTEARENGKQESENLKRKEGKDKKRENHCDCGERSEIQALTITVFPLSAESPGNLGCVCVWCLAGYLGGQAVPDNLGFLPTVCPLFFTSFEYKMSLPRQDELQ